MRFCFMIFNLIMHEEVMTQHGANNCLSDISKLLQISNNGANNCFQIFAQWISLEYLMTSTLWEVVKRGSGVIHSPTKQTGSYIFTICSSLVFALVLDQVIIDLVQHASNISYLFVLFGHHRNTFIIQILNELIVINTKATSFTRLSGKKWFLWLT